MKDRIVDWLRFQLEKTGKKGFVVGVSGGIDSAVVSALCKLATPNVKELFMPFEEISPIYYNMLNLFYTEDKIALANLQARIRMCILYLCANTEDYLVCGTGNKSELTMGYFTKYGDGGVDILPLGDLTKTEVRKLAKELGIPQEIIDKPPSAGLWEGQTDEGEMGITYKMIDKVIMANRKGQHKVSSIPIWEGK
jgi:NAD+ synthase